MTPEQLALQKRVLKGKTPVEYLEAHYRDNPRSPGYEPKRHNAHPEKDLQKTIVEWLTLKKITFLELVVKPSTFMQDGRMVRVRSPMAGWPDLNLIVNGRYGGCELKVKSAQSDAQKEAQARIEAGGGVYRLCRSIGDVEGLINELRK